jgi:hypothetical protein
MRKLLPALLVCATLLPGCVLAIGNGDDGKSAKNRLEHLEHRVSMLEQQLHEPMGAPPMPSQPGVPAPPADAMHH